MRVPKRFNGTPKRSNGTPKRSNGTPKRSNGTPKRSNGTPKRSNGTPKRRNGMPKRRNGPPKRHIGPPKRHSGPPKRHTGAAHPTYVAAYVGAKQHLRLCVATHDVYQALLCPYGSVHPASEESTSPDAAVHPASGDVNTSDSGQWSAVVNLETVRQSPLGQWARGQSGLGAVAPQRRAPRRKGASARPRASVPHAPEQAPVAWCQARPTRL